MKLKDLPIILGFLTLALTLPVSVLMLSQKQTTQVGASRNATGLLYLWPSAVTIRPGQQIPMELKIDTRGQAAKTAEAIINYDPRKISLVPDSFAAGEGITLSQNAQNENSGTLTVAAVGDLQKNKTLVRLTLQTKGEGKTELTIANGHIWDTTGTTDILESALGASFVVQ